MTNDAHNETSDLTQTATKVNLKTGVAGILIFGGVVLLYQLVWIFLEGAGARIYDRVLQQLDYLPMLVAEHPEKKKVIVFGSSMVQAGFDPLLFDELMEDKNNDVVSYNYGIGNMNPEFQDLISRRIKEQFISQDKKLDLAIIEFNPFQTTSVRRISTKAIDEQNIAVLSNNKELWQHTLQDPTMGIRLFTIRYLRRGVSAELFTAIPSMINSDDSPVLQTAEYKEERQKRSELEDLFYSSFAKDVPNRENLGWDPATRGARLNKTHLSDQSLVHLDNLMHSFRYRGFMEADLVRRINTSDILELGFDDALIESFINIVENFQAFSDHVEVVMLPRNTDWVQYSPEVQARLDNLFNNIGTRTGASLRNFQTHPAITPEHFRDTTHLSSYDGVDIFTKILADEYGDLLSD